MNSSNQLAAIAAIEQADAVWPTVPGMLEYLESDSYRANYSDDSHCMSNRVSRARLDNDTAPAAIDRLVTFYNNRKLDFVWSVGPLSTPANLGELLEERGFNRLTRCDGLYLSGFEKVAVSIPGFEIT